MKTFKFDREGLQQALEHKDYIGMIKETIEEHPELLPIALGIVVSISALIVSPGATAIAYKASFYDSSIVAFKYLGGF